MAFTESQWAALVGHASTRSGATRAIDAQVQASGSGIIVFRYVLHAEIARVHAPPACTPERADGLWNHTCFEAFVMAPDTVGYYELNFAPSRQWAVYRFAAYRVGMSEPRLNAPPVISVRRFADRLELDAAVRLHDLIGLQGEPRLRLGLSAVVEEESGMTSYWALKHGP